MNTKNINSIAYFFICFFLGGLGVHKFIDGKIGLGILYLLTGGIFGIGWFVDIIRAFILIFSSKKEPAAPVAYQNPVYNAPQPSSVSNYQNKTTDNPKEFGARDVYRFPEKIDNCCLTYRYFITLNEINIDALKRIEQTKNYKLTLDDQGYVYSDGEKIASIPNDNRVRMYEDWNKRGWPYICELNHACIYPLNATLRLVFYRDNNKYFDERYKKITCKLTACTSEEKQDEIETLEIGSLLDFETEINDRTGNEDYLVTKIDYIGKLPKKAVEIDKKFGIEKITVADLLEDDNFHTIPFVNVYYSE